MRTQNEKLSISKEKSWQMFNEIAKTYDLLNRLLAFGLDIQWRKKLLTFMDKADDIEMLDLATGTADVLIMLAKEKAAIIKGVGVDMAANMLEIGRHKIQKAQLDQRLELKEGDANNIPADENSFDYTTMSFGIRNVEDPTVVLKEMRRVLRGGGRTLILEFSLPKNLIVRWGHIFYLRHIVPVIGWMFSGHYRAYKYLNQTIEDFPYGDAFCQLLKDAGFVNVKANPLFLGVATIYQGDKQ